MFQGQVASGKAFGDALETKIRLISNHYTKYSIQFPDAKNLKGNVSESAKKTGR